MVRRLPVLQNQSDPNAVDRPLWQWVLIGAALLISFWIPLLALALWLRSRLVPEAQPAGVVLGFVAALGPVIVPWMIASVLATLLHVRFGHPRVTRRHAVYAAMVATGLVVAIAALGGSLDNWPTALASALLLMAAAAGSSWFAGKFGSKRQLRR